MVGGVWKVWVRGWGMVLSVRVVYLPNLSLLMSLEPLKPYLCGGGARKYIMRSQRLYHEEPEIISWGVRYYIMRIQRLYDEEPEIRSWGARYYIMRSQRLYHEEPENISWGAWDYIMGSQTLYHEEPEIISWGTRDYFMRSQRLYRVESHFSVSLNITQVEQCPNFNLGILKTEGGLYFSKMSELKISLRHHQK